MQPAFNPEPTATAPAGRRLFRSICNELHAGADYTPEELEFLKAIDEYKRLHRRPFPTWREVLHVLRSLGWKK